jgi:hypothetical protein
MPSASSEIVINCPRDDVFAFLADHHNDPQWRSGDERGRILLGPDCQQHGC